MSTRSIRFALSMICGLLSASLPAQTATQPASARELAQSIRSALLDPEQCYLVRDLSLIREDIKLYFNEGYLIFSKPVAGERLSAVFAGVDENADGEILLLPPLRGERISLAKFTQAPNLNEHFRAALLTFTDGSAEKLLAEITSGGRGRKAPEAAPILAERWNTQIAQLTANVVQRILADVMAPSRGGGGFLFLALFGNRLGNFDVIFDPIGEDQIVAGTIADHGGQNTYDIWTGFPARSIRTGAAKAYDPPYTMDNYRIQASLGQDLSLKAITRATLHVNAEAARTFMFGLSRGERVTAARLDGMPVELVLQDSQRGRAPRPDENEIFLMVAPQALPIGTAHEIEIEHEGAVIVDRGNSVYSVDARSNWYPRARMEFAQYDLEFRYPADLTLVTPGEVVEDRIEDQWRITRRRSVVPIRVAGFNLGDYGRVTSEADGFTIDVYGNRGLDPSLAPRPQLMMMADAVRPLNRGSGGRNPSAILQTPPAPDPLGRLKAVATDVADSSRFFATLFGPPPLKTLTVSPIPGTTGQGFPGLIYLSTLSYLDEKQRPPSARGERERLFFSDLMVAHEVAHQWWGNIIATRNYQDDWLLEALAHYSALLWLEQKRGPQAMEAELAAFRNDLLQGSADGGKVDSFGPLIWGYRLESAREPDTWRAITYEKGSWVLHMLRHRMGDTAFFKFLKELRQRFQFRDVSNQDFQALASDFLPAPQPGRSPKDVVAAFFEGWIEGTGIPELRLRYSTRNLSAGRNPTFEVTGTIDQEQVSVDFSVDVPLEIQFAAGMPQTHWVRSNENGGSFRLTFPQQPTRVSILSSAILATVK